jgi:indole-3-glycerol phosphate synthase
MILDEILAEKRREIAVSKSRRSLEALHARAEWTEKRRGFARALRAKSGRAIIAEIKKASPSRGVIRSSFDPARHARDYETSGATCISVLTDGPFFQGHLDHLAIVRASTALPILRKDFILDPYQIAEARAFGADAVLLIVAALEASVLRELAALSAAEGMDTLVEVHDEGELEIALGAGASLIGINNRDLRTFETSLDVSRRLAPLAPPGVVVIAESGIRSATDLSSLAAVGVHAFLVGEQLMASKDPGKALASLL